MVKAAGDRIVLKGSHESDGYAQRRYGCLTRHPAHDFLDRKMERS